MKTELYVKNGDIKEYIPIEDVIICYEDVDIPLKEAVIRNRSEKDFIKASIDDLAAEIDVIKRTLITQAEVNKKIVAMIKQMQAEHDSDLV